jgi:hypothetical protein
LSATSHVVVGVLLLIGGCLLGLMAFADEERFPKPDDWVIKYLTYSKRRAEWTWRYRIGYGGGGLIVMVSGVTLIVQR